MRNQKKVKASLTQINKDCSKMLTTVSNLKNLELSNIFETVRKANIIVVSKKSNKRSEKIIEIIKELKDAECNEKIFRDDEILSIDKVLSESMSACHVAVDISCIPGDTMASLFHIIAKHSSRISIKVDVIYCLAKYIDPKPDLSPNETVAPAHPRFAGWLAKPKFPILTIVGLGYEKDKALGAIEYLDASKSFLFIPTSSEEEYEGKVMEQNNDLLITTNPQHIFKYDVHDPVGTIHILNSILLAAKAESKPVLLPFGPKIFFSAALVVALIHPEASVWYVSGEKNDVLHDEQDVSSVFGYSFSLSTVSST